MDDGISLPRGKATTMHKRLEMPMGTKPAARVLRPFGGSTAISPSKYNIGNAVSVQKVNGTEEAEMVQSLTLGPIVEHQCGAKKKKDITAPNSNDKIKPLSRFAQSLETGFPSTTVNVPMGSLVAPKKSLSVIQAPKIKNDDEKELLRVTSSDSQAMLNDMSLAEIQESVKELENSLDPSIIAFLRERGNKKGNKDFLKSQIVEKKPTQSDSPKSRNSTQQTEEEPWNSVYTKESLSKMLSSIQTYDDLDDAYDVFQSQLNDKTSDGKIKSSNPLAHVPVYGMDDDFGLACSLLRSTSPQQTLWASRVVCRGLQNEVKAKNRSYRLVPLSDSNDRDPPWPFPPLLPVSLRCLLDTNMSLGGGLVLQTAYVLQSLYALLQLRACSDHVVDIAGNDEFNEASLYQLNFLDDAVPTPSLKVCYSATPIKPIAVDEMSNNITSSDTADAIYATSASPTSAQSDAEAFLRDPMWALLSQMRILPRLSHLLQRGGSTVSREYGDDSFNDLLPKEALVAICGILAMIGQRSPGAASAIVLNQNILDNLTLLCWKKSQNSCHYNASVAQPVVILMCVLARQSHIVAESLSNRFVGSTFFLEILASKYTSNNAMNRLQQWVLVLWRTLLRYGQCFSVLPTMITLSAPHLASVSFCSNQLNTSSIDLSPEYYSCFGVVLSCIRALNKSTLESTLSTGLHYQKFGLSQEHFSIVSKAGIWLSSPKQQAIRCLSSFNLRVQCDETVTLRSITSVLQFLCNYFEIVHDVDLEFPTSGEYPSETMTLADAKECIDALHEIFKSKEMTEFFEAHLSKYCSESMDNFPPLTKLEASSCAFLDSLIRVATSLGRICRKIASDEYPKLHDKIDEIARKLVDLLHFGQSPIVLKTPNDTQRKRVATIQSARRHWLNKVQMSVVTFLHDTEFDRRILRDKVFSVIGSLQLGEERDALVLFGFDHIMCLDDLQTNWNQSQSPISTLLVRELCRSPQARHQLDHSFRLFGGLGMSADSTGPFGLKSLLSEAAQLEPGLAVSEYLLPIGKYWLWQILSGSVVVSSESKPATCTSPDESQLVLLAALGIIEDLETCDSICGYCHRLHVGAKLYFIATICLHPEKILSDDRIMSLASNLLDIYIRRFNRDEAHVFGEVCCSHSESKITRSSLSDNEEKQLQAILEPKEQDEQGFSTNTIRSMEVFLNDLCDVFLDYGAQYSFFSRAVRIFLTNGMPSKIRCTVINRLQGAFHLLSVQDESICIKSIQAYMESGLPSVDNNILRDSPVLLDSIAAAFSRGTIVRQDDTFFSFWAVAMLARSLACSLSDNKFGLFGSRLRLQNLENSIFSRVIHMTAYMLMGEYTCAKPTCKDLLHVNEHSCLPPDRLFEDIPNEVERWDEALKLLKDIQSDKGTLRSEGL